MMEQNSSKKEHRASKALPKNTRTDMLSDTGSSIVSVTFSSLSPSVL